MMIWKLKASISLPVRMSREELFMLMRAMWAALLPHTDGLARRILVKPKASDTVLHTVVGRDLAIQTAIPQAQALGCQTRPLIRRVEAEGRTTIPGWFSRTKAMRWDPVALVRTMRSEVEWSYYLWPLPLQTVLAILTGLMKEGELSEFTGGVPRHLFAPSLYAYLLQTLEMAADDHPMSIRIGYHRVFTSPTHGVGEVMGTMHINVLNEPCTVWFREVPYFQAPDGAALDEVSIRMQCIREFRGIPEFTDCPGTGSH